MTHIKAVLSQCGVAMELHEHEPNPITLMLIRPAEMDRYKAELAKSNPDYRYATLGQLAVMYANRLFSDKGILITQCPWTYNASDDRYEQAR